METAPESSAREQPSATELRAVAAFRTELRRFVRRTEAVTSGAGLTSQRYDLLLIIKSSPGERSTVSELAKGLQLPQTAVTELVRRTIDSGLVEREQSTRDRRVWHLHLTQEGERRLVTAFNALQADRDALARMLRSVGRHFRAAEETSRRTKGESRGAAVETAADEPIVVYLADSR